MLLVARVAESRNVLAEVNITGPKTDETMKAYLLLLSAAQICRNFAFGLHRTCNLPQVLYSKRVDGNLIVRAIVFR